MEEHVRPDWWRHIFNSIYLKTDSDVVDDQRITRQEADMFSGILRLSPDDRIFDLCCGPGRHSLELARMGFRHVEGLDRSHYLIQKAKANAKKEGLSIRFREGDARKLPHPPDAFDAAMLLGNSFGYFETVQDDLRVLKGIFRVLKPWGRFIIDVADGEYVGEHFQPRSWEWMDNNHFVCWGRSLALDGQRLISREVVTHVGKGVIADQFYTRESLYELLKTAGFSEITFHGELSSDSQRNQDMGMMERRIVVTAVVRKEWTPLKKRKRSAVRNVVAIFGDPSKPDPIKRFIYELCDFIKMKRYGDCMVVRFGEGDMIGYSAVQLIETSLISAHFVDASSDGYIDIFSCKYYRPEDALTFCKDFFEAKDSKYNYLLRI